MPSIIGTASPIELFGSILCVTVSTFDKGSVDKIINITNIDLFFVIMGFSVVAIDVDVGLRNLGLENCVNHTFIEVLNDDKERQRNKGKKERERVVER